MLKTSDKIKSRADLVQLRQDNSDVRYGFTSGTYDLLHPGHVAFLEEAKNNCDCLIVAVNSDASVKGYKSELRPIMPQEARAKCVAGLAAVDYVFIFDELNNSQNITEIKPDFYFKAGDYTVEKLGSAKKVQEYGGQVKILDFEEGYSTTSIVNEVIEKYAVSTHSYDSAPELSRAPALFLDRDGTINVFKDYIYDPEQFELIPDVLDAVRKFQDQGFRIVIVTNQPGIDFGYFEMEKVFGVNKKMLGLCHAAGVKVDKIYFSPYTQARETDCRKPKTALVKRAEKELNIDLNNSIVVGDSLADIRLGQAAGCKTVLVETGVIGHKETDITPDLRLKSLAELDPANEALK